MIPAPLPANEEQRLQKLYELDILDTLEEQVYDDITHLVAQICGVPIALISLIDRDRQFLKSHLGLDATEVSRELGFCPHAILDNDLTIVEDATKDERFHDNPLVTDGLRVRFYAGAPLIMPGDLRVGTLCVVGTEPRTINEDQAKALEALARQVVSQLKLRQSVKLLEAANWNGQAILEELERSEQRERNRGVVLEKLAKGKPIGEILETLILGIEEELKGSLCSILLVDKGGRHFLQGAAPNLPAFYNDAIDGLEFAVGLGSCGNAAATGERTIVSDIAHHPFWEQYKDLAAEAGLAACWSEPVLDGSGNVLATFAIYYDTPRSPVESDIAAIENAANLAGIAIQHKKDERSLIDAKLTAESASRAKSEFLSSMSHELRTPMNAVLGFAQLMQLNPNDPLSESQKSYVLNILKAANHLLELINQVLELSMIEAGKLSLSLDHAAARDVIDESLQLVGTRAKDEGIQIIDRTVGVDLPLLWTDSTRVTQALLNLLSNAIKYNRENGTVTLTAQELPNRMLRISVADTGRGVPIAKQDLLFKPFERLGWESGEIEGAGVGLTITKQIIELLRGQIGYRSEQDKGSTFWIDVPLSSKQAHGPQEVEVEPDAGGNIELKHVEGSVHTVLYVEDNLANLQLVEAILDQFTNINELSRVPRRGVLPAGCSQ